MLKKLVLLAVTLLSMFMLSMAYAAVEINTADQTALDGIAGIGPATSRAILEERKKMVISRIGLILSIACAV